VKKEANVTDYSQPGIINALDYGLVPNNQTESVMIANTAALIAAISAAQASCSTPSGGSGSYGGTVVIPSNDAVPSESGNGDGGVYYFATSLPSGPAITISCQYPILILGTGNGTKLVMTQAFDFLVVNNAVSGESGSGGGVTFQDLEIAYSTGLTSGAAIRVTGGSQNIRLLRMVLTDCPVGVALDNSLHCSMINCIVWNEENSGNAVTLGTTTSGDTAIETYISDCIFAAASPNNGAGTGLTIVNVDEVRVVSTRIQGYAQGTAIMPEVGYCVHLFFENVTAIPYLASSSSTGGAALLIQPPSSGAGSGSVLQAVFVGCEFGQTDNDTEYIGPGVFIDQSQTTGFIDQLRFVSCWSSGWPGNGMQINGTVTQTEIIGGCYSCNGQSSEAPSPATGINITSPASGTHAGIRIIGAACNNSVYSNESPVGYLPATQDIGISIASGATNVLVHKCDLTNNESAGLQATSPGATVQVSDCAGYNDQVTQLATTAPGNGDTFYSYTYKDYAGQAVFYVSGGSSVKVTIDGVDTGLKEGGFTLGPNESASIQYDTAPAFLMVGK
jgi:hypothetical protein